eukprot:1190395-Prorocentrum_minimum.AAC.3
MREPDSGSQTLNDNAKPAEPNAGFAKILSLIGTDSGLSQAPLETFRDANSPVAKLYNWNLLTPVLKALAIDVDQDDKALIVAGVYWCIGKYDDISQSA